jgi:hypothetical protein
MSHRLPTTPHLGPDDPLFTSQHNANKTVMTGFLSIAQRVPLKRFSSGKQKGKWGGELGVDLQWLAPGDGYSLIFMDTISGTVYHKSKKFPIYAAAEAPANYTTAGEL